MQLEFIFTRTQGKIGQHKFTIITIHCGTHSKQKTLNADTSQRLNQHLDLQLSFMHDIGALTEIGE